jgi:CopG family nickel-responsive transcriptional regulator
MKKGDTMQIRRFGVSLEDDLLRQLDDLVKKRKLPNRSQAIRFLIRKNLVQEKWEGNEKVNGCVVLIYNHHKRELLDKSIDAQHKYQHLVLAVQHAHLDHDNCLEAIIVKGKARELKDLADRLIALKGIKHGELVMSVND